MKYQIKTSTRFKRDLKRCAKRGLDMRLFYDAINLLAATGPLPAEYKPHQLKGDHKAAIKREQCKLAQTLSSVSRLDRRSRANRNATLNPIG